MSKLYIKQKVFSWGDKFHIFDQRGNEVLFVKGEVFSFGKKLHMFNNNGDEICFIHQKLLTLRPKYYINRNGDDIAEVIKEFTFFKDKYTIRAFGWTVEGNFTDHEYAIHQGNSTIAVISKKWLSWGDTYQIDASDNADMINVLSVVLIIDAVKAAEQAAANA